MQSTSKQTETELPSAKCYNDGQMQWRLSDPEGESRNFYNIRLPSLGTFGTAPTQLLTVPAEPTDNMQHSKVLGSTPVRKGRLYIFQKNALKLNHHFYTFRVYEIKF